ncbi:tetratricopeptide repeat protein [Rodentibacter trehalosifermentans]|nr:SEL1-like repeat protein [Rodentibacter trehalosifermentans]
MNKKKENLSNAKEEKIENVRIEGDKLIYRVKSDSLLYKGKSYFSLPDRINDLERIAKQGNVIAQAELGYIYYTGKDIPVDYEKAEYWLKKSADGDLLVNHQSKNLLAALYEDKGDINSAIFWYEKAAENDFIDSQINLGLLYEKQEQLEKAKKWYEVAANLGSGSGIYNLGVVLYKINNENVNKSIELLLKSKNSNVLPLIDEKEIEYSLGWLYLNDNKIRDINKAIKLFESSAQKGFVESQFLLGEIYDTNHQVKDLQKSQYWYSEAAKQGDKDAIERLNTLFNTKK